MSAPLRLKKPKVETDTVVGATEMAHENGGDGGGGVNNNDDSSSNREEQEEALVALIEHRTKEVEHLRKRVLYYNSQLEQAEKRLQDSESKLVRLRRSGDSVASSRNYLENGTKKVKMESQPSSSIEVAEGCSKSQPQLRPELLIPAVNPRISQPIKLADSGTKGSLASGGRASASVSRHSNSNGKLEKVQRLQEAVENQDKGTKRKLEEKEHKELIPLIRSRTSPSLIRCQTSSPISSQHKRKMRSLALCPVNDHLFVTSALDGVVNLWQIQGKGSGASRLSTTDCVSPKLRRWPEDVAWHPQGDSLFFTYCADGDSQISFMNLNKTDERARVTFLDDKPHVKGIINSISFLPLDTTCFVTGGSDHAVIIWKEKDGGNSWKPKALHRNLHSSAVMGVAGMQQKHIVISAGADKRIFGFDLLAERTDFKHQIESKCMSVLPNPCDFNLFMVQTATPERQLKLYDIRLRQTEIHEFGWKQESSESQSALINQAWSPDGLYITSGSADPVIHIFDIRYNARKPSQSVKAHQKRVFKALWHFSLPLLISISSDLNIELHKIT